MDHSHTFDFPDGSVISSIAPGKFFFSPCLLHGVSKADGVKEIKGFYPAEDEYYDYFDPKNAASVLLALSQVESYIKEEGPFGGVLGFSQGATLAASYLAQLEHRHTSEPPPFRCAIFLCGGIPFDPQALDRGEVRFIDPRESGAIFALPTASIWSRNDQVLPGMSQKLDGLCADMYKNVYTYDEGHNIPGPRSKEAVQGCVRAIRRTIEQAETMQ
ncbi:MAG: hypothetical protein Q9168_006620 [Polycauliona sp. 1 TL-2023]